MKNPFEKLNKIRQEKLPQADKSARQELLKFDPDLEYPLNRLADLPEEIQDNIFSYIVKKRNDGMPKEEVTELLEILIDKSFHLLGLTSEDSDTKLKKFSPEVNKTLEELMEKIAEYKVESAELNLKREEYHRKGYKSNIH